MQTIPGKMAQVDWNFNRVAIIQPIPYISYICLADKQISSFFTRLSSTSTLKVQTNKPMYHRVFFQLKLSGQRPANSISVEDFHVPDTKEFCNKCNTSELSFTFPVMKCEVRLASSSRCLPL